MKVKVGNASAFWGDSDFGASLIAKEVDYLTLDYLAEVSLSILAIQREKDPLMGYAADFLPLLGQIAPFCADRKLKVVTNAGGLHPKALAKKVKERMPSLRIFSVSGDDVLPLVKAPFPLVTANAYLGADPVLEALKAGADIVITGRVADPSMTVAPCLERFGWRLDDWELIAAATVAGHLIECGTQATGGIATDWLSLPLDPPIGFPFVELSEKGDLLIGKASGTGGRVDEMTVKEQLLYEIGDPKRYISPDATVDFSQIEVEQIGKDLVKVKGMKGSAPTDSYKVSATYRAGYKAEGNIVLFGTDLKEKAEASGRLLFDKLRRRGYTWEENRIELIGAGAIPYGGASSLREGVLRLAIRSEDREAVEAFSRELASLVTCGPAGTTGYSSGRPKARPAFGFWSCLIGKDQVKYRIEEV